MKENKFEEVISFTQSLNNSSESVERLYSFLLGMFEMERPLEKDYPKLGKLITVDGHSGAGKDTQIELLEQKLGADAFYQDYNIVMFVQKKQDPFRQVAKYLWQNHDMHPGNDCSILLLTAGRKHFVYSFLLPYLSDEQNLVIQNRSYLSQLAYHASNETELTELIKISDFDPVSNISFVLECETLIAYDRVMKRSPEKGGIIYPNEKPDYISRVKRNFKALGDLVPTEERMLLFS